MNKLIIIILIALGVTGCAESEIIKPEIGQKFETPEKVILNGVELNYSDLEKVNKDLIVNSFDPGNFGQTTCKKGFADEGGALTFEDCAMDINGNLLEYHTCTTHFLYGPPHIWVTCM